MNNVWVGILILIICPALVSTRLYGIKEKHNSVNVIKNMILYLLIYYDFISCVKCVLGEEEYSILKSFEENSGRTYLHYLLPIVFLCIVLPLIHRKMEKICFPSKTYFFEIFLSVTYCAMLTSVMNNEIISNLYISIGGVLAVAISMIQCTCKGKIELNNTKENIVIKGKKTIPVLLFWAVSFLIFAPNQLYLQNISEFRVSFPNFLFTFLSWTVIYMLVATTGCLLFIPNQILNYFLGFIFAMTICGYFQDNFLNGTMAPLDGTHQSWSVITQIVNVGVWSVLIVVFLFLVWKWKEKMVNVIRIASIYLVLIHIVTLGFLIASTDWDNNHNYALTTDKMLELDSNNNVVVFILDWYDEQVLEEINRKNPEFLEQLQGFTWYQNQTSRYTFTDMSIPYLLSDVEWEEGTTEEEYAKYADENGEFLQDIQKNGYDIGIYTESQLVKDSKHIVSNFTNRSRGTCKFYTTMKKLVQCARYQRMPFVLKKDYWYTTADLADIAADKNLYEVDNLSFYHRITPDKLEAKKEDRNGAFRFYHISGVHDLKITEELVEGNTDVFSEGKGAMKIIYDYLEQMKKLGVYDTATIIITADHGQNYLNKPEELKQRNLQMTSNPILLVKKKSKSTGFSISIAPVSHTDFFATIMKEIDASNTKYGQAYDEIADNERRVREMIFYRTQDVPCTRYKIDGLATNQSSWSLVNGKKKNFSLGKNI